MTDGIPIHLRALTRDNSPAALIPLFASPTASFPRSYHPKTGYESLVQGAHKSTVWATKHLPQNRDVFVTCGGDGSGKVWK